MTDRVKTSLFDSLAPRLIGARVVDLYAGVGGLGIEALSRGAAFCTFVERDPTCIGALQFNLEKTRLAERAEIAQKDVENAVEAFISRKLTADIVLFDPPFAAGKPPERPELEALAHRIAGGLLETGGLLVYHHEADTVGQFDTPRLEVLDRRNYGRNRVTVSRVA